MRFRYKRPKIEDVNEELTTLLEVMSSDLFIFVDLFFYSLFFTLLLTPLFHTFTISILFFAGCYLFFCTVYFFIFKSIFKKLNF